MAQNIKMPTSADLMSMWNASGLKAKIETLPNAPPENKSRNPIMLFPPAILEKISLFIPKIGS